MGQGRQRLVVYTIYIPVVVEVGRATAVFIFFFTRIGEKQSTEKKNNTTGGLPLVVKSNQIISSVQTELTIYRVGPDWDRSLCPYPVCH